jgi:hypothetical protein
LTLIFAGLVLVAGLAHVIGIGLEEQDLTDALVGIDLRRQRGRIGDFEGDVAFPLGLEGRDVGNDSAASVGGLASAKLLGGTMQTSPSNSTKLFGSNPFGSTIADKALVKILNSRATRIS